MMYLPTQAPANTHFALVFFIPRPNISFPHLTLFGCQASETDGDIQIKKRRNDDNEQPHK